MVCQNGTVSTSKPVVRPVGDTATLVREQELTALNWVTIVWDDPVNMMSYVTHVFATYFGYPTEKANELMLRVHNSGKAVVSSGSREQMELDVDAMHSYGLWASMEPG